MPAIVQPIFWNKCEGIVGGVVPSMIGPDGIPVGTPLFDPCEFGNGVYSSESDSDYLSFPSVVPAAVANDRWSISYYAKMPYDSGAGPSDAHLGDPNYGLTIYYVATQQKFVVWSWGTVAYMFNPSFLAGENHHFAWLFDKSAGDYDKIKLKMDGDIVPFAGLYYGYNTVVDYASNITINTNVYIGSRKLSIIDNLKIYDHLMSDPEIAWDIANEGLQSGATRRQLHRLVIN